ncbi:RHS repeat domain-containing protein, partial [Alicyclobacillus cycloheptanicus]
GNLLQSYTYGPNGEPLTLTTWSGGTGTTYYYVENGHGDVVALTDASGNIVAQYTYDAWGNILSSSGTLANTNPYLYAGYRWDSAVGMYYLNARYYSPSLMRFISRDPLGSSTNDYPYADDNPVDKVDPSGEYGEGVAVLAEFGVFEAADTTMDWNPIGWGLAIGGAIYFGGTFIAHNIFSSPHHSYAQNKKTARKKIGSLEDHVREHEEKIKNNPSSQDIPHWQNEINAAKEQINKLKKRWNLK